MEIPEFIDSQFRYTIMVAKRAKQLINGAKKLIDVDAENPLTIAIQEVNSGKVSYELMNDMNFYLTDSIDEGSEAEADEKVIENNIKEPKKE